MNSSEPPSFNNYYIIGKNGHYVNYLVYIYYIIITIIDNYIDSEKLKITFVSNYNKII